MRIQPRSSPVEYEDVGLGVFAEHGNRYDSLNYHQRQQGCWAIGDAIVLRVVNRFGALARQELHLTEGTALGRAVHEIDNVEPNLHIPLYVSWLAQTKLTGKTDRRKLMDCWRKTVNEFLDLQEFQEERYGKFATAIRWLRTLYGLFDLDDLLKHLSKIPPEISGQDSLRAHLVKTDAELRIFGHTHISGLHPLPIADGRRRYYVNTGTWRRVISSVSIGNQSVDFAAHRVSAFLTVRAPGEFFLSSQCQVP